MKQEELTLGGRSETEINNNLLVVLAENKNSSQS